MQDTFNYLMSNYKREYSKEATEELESFLDEYLKVYPCDTEKWILLALIVYYPPLHDDVKAENCLKRVLEYDPNNIRVTLLLVYIVTHYCYTNQDLFERLNNLHTDDKALLALIEYEKSWYYSVIKDHENYGNSLKKSVELCDTYVRNNAKLGYFYLEKNRLSEGYKYLKKALDNVQYVYEENHDKDFLDIEEFFNERLRGIHISRPNFEILCESFDPKSPWMTGDFTKKNKYKMGES